MYSSLAGRMARLSHQLTPEELKSIEEITGKPLTSITGAIVHALDPDRQLEAAQEATGDEQPTAEAIERAATRLLDAAAKPIASNPALRNKLITLKQAAEQTIDKISKDSLLEAGYSAAATEKARSIVQSFEQFIRNHKDEITAIQLLYTRPYRNRLTLKQLKQLAETIQKPPRNWESEELWRAYELLDKSKVRGSGGKIITDLVSLIRFALQQETELRPFADQVRDRYDHWLASQQNGRRFTPEQLEWLALIRDHIAGSLAIEPDDFDYVPFNQRGGLGKAHQLFGPDLPKLLNELNEVLAA